MNYFLKLRSEIIFNCREKKWSDIYTDVSGDEEEADHQLSHHPTFREYESKLHQSTSGKINSQRI
jgi:hypothetical protein